jgi:hypothetical protein
VPVKVQAQAQVHGGVVRESVVVGDYGEGGRVKVEWHQGLDMAEVFRVFPRRQGLVLLIGCLPPPVQVLAQLSQGFQFHGQTRVLQCICLFVARQGHAGEPCMVARQPSAAHVSKAYRTKHKVDCVPARVVRAVWDGHSPSDP